MKWLDAMRARGRLLRRSESEARMDEEMRFHLEMEAERLIREEALSPGEARRRAVLAFGGVEGHRERMRDGRTLAWLGGMSLDLKLGLRMLRNYPAVTLVGGLAIALGIAVGAVTFESVKRFVHPEPPFGDRRIVSIVNWGDMVADRRVLHHYAIWREQLTTVEEIGAFRTVQRNVALGEEMADLVRLSESSASAFRIASVPPLLGRTLVADDERPGAEPVAVIGRELWESRFGADPTLIGRRIRLDGVGHTVVGVMPAQEEFEFIPGELWTAFRLDPLRYARRESPEIQVFGRLAPGVSFREAQAELEIVSSRVAEQFSEAHGELRPEVVPFRQGMQGLRFRGTLRVGAYSANLVAALFLALVCANVSILVFARTVAREGELVVRTALGASRQRIVAQLFAEALVLGGVAAVLGLAAASFGMRWTISALTEGVNPLELSGLSPTTIGYTTLLTLLCAVVVGVVPALRVTRTRADGQFRRVGAGDSGLRFGPVWTGVIVTQVALTLITVLLLSDTVLDVRWMRNVDLGFAAEEFVSARVGMESASPVAGAADDQELGRLTTAYRELERRLEAEPGVVAVTHSTGLPGEYHDRRWIEVEGGTLEAGMESRLQTADVDPDFFEALGAPIVAGRAFDNSDLGEGTRTVIANQSFVDTFLGGRNAVGVRIRYANGRDPYERPEDEVAPGPWHEVVGVVRDLATTLDAELPHHAALYHPAAPVGPLRIAVRVRGMPEAFVPRLRALGTAADPALRLEEIQPLTGLRADALNEIVVWLKLGFLAGALLLLLSYAGMYSILSFTVSRRTREIGIRIALGADRRRIVTGVLSRSLSQLGLGIVVGVVLLISLNGGLPRARGMMLLGGSVALMVGLGALACLVPTRRAFRIEPTEALRADG